MEGYYSIAQVGQSHMQMEVRPHSRDFNQGARTQHGNGEHAQVQSPDSCMEATRAKVFHSLCDWPVKDAAALVTETLLW